MEEIDNSSLYMQAAEMQIAAPQDAVHEDFNRMLRKLVSSSYGVHRNICVDPSLVIFANLKGSSVLRTKGKSTRYSITGHPQHKNILSSRGGVL